MRKKAQNTPIPASIPKDLSAAMLDVMLAMNATIVVTEVSMIASPTLLIDLRTACSEVAPDLRSSLYLCRLCRLSSISRASISIGSRFENCDLKITSYPDHFPMIIAQPINPYIQTRDRERLVATIPTSDTLLRLAQRSIRMANPIIKIRNALEISSRLISTLIDSANIRETIVSSLSLRSSSRDRYSHSTEHRGCPSSSFCLQISTE